jgi:hypothetical protein
MNEKQKCNALIGRIFIELETVGIRRSTISILTLQTYDFIPDHTNLEVWIEDEKRLADVIRWLRLEGAVYVEAMKPKKYKPTLYVGMQLTSKGAAILETLESNRPQLQAAAEKNLGNSSSFYTNLGDLIGSALGSFTKSIGN